MTALDLRLLPVAFTLWLGAAVGLHLPLDGRFLLAVVAGGVSLTWLRRRPGAAWIAAALVGIVVAAFRADAADPAAVSAAIEDAGAVGFVAVIDSEPQQLERRGFGGLTVEPVMQAHATLVTVETDVVRWHTSLPVTLQWQPDGSRHAVGERVRGRSVPRPADIATRSAYWIRVQGRLHVEQRESRAAWLASSIRAGLARATGAEHGGDGDALLPGLVLGDTRAQSARLVDDLRQSGLSHLTAVSGANLAIVLGAMMWALRRTRISPRARYVTLFATIAAFVVVVQPQPSVVRAAMMGGISVFALASGARRASASTLWLSVVVLLVVDPFLAWQWGFALSVAATAGLILIGPRLAAAFADRRLGAVLAITLSAQLATFPVLLAMGRPPTWLSIPANVLCEPLVAPATVSGFLAAVIAGFALIPNDSISAAALALAAMVAWPGARLADVIAGIAHHGVGTPLAVAPITTLTSLGLVAIAVVVLVRLGLRRRGFLFLLGLSVLLTSCLPDGLHRWPQADWWYAMCDVGQGDSTVVNLGGGDAIVIDVGPDPVLERRCLRQLGVHRVSALILTHFHADHVEGLAGALRQAEIRAVFSTPIHEPATEWRRVVEQLGREPIGLQEGDELRFGTTRVRILWPVVAEATGDPNNASLVLDVVRRHEHLLVTGDIDPAAQSAIRLPIAGYAVLKIPHHGSRFQDPNFVQRVAPALALVSAGEGNDYGHPALDTLDAYRAAGVRVLRTDTSGAIAVSVRGGRLSFTTLSY